MVEYTHKERAVHDGLVFNAVNLPCTATTERELDKEFYLLGIVRE
jgi:hypothetical protein